MMHKLFYGLCSLALLSGALIVIVHVEAEREGVSHQKHSSMEYMTRNIECEQAKVGRSPGVFVVTDQMGMTITCMK